MVDLPPTVRKAMPQRVDGCPGISRFSDCYVEDASFDLVAVYHCPMESKCDQDWASDGPQEEPDEKDLHCETEARITRRHAHKDQRES